MEFEESPRIVGTTAMTPNVQRPDTRPPTKVINWVLNYRLPKMQQLGGLTYDDYFTDFPPSANGIALNTEAQR